MLTPEQWDVLFSPEAGLSLRICKHRVAIEVRKFLAAIAPGITLSTNDLGEALYPRAIAEQSLAGDRARSKIFKILGVLATGALADCCVKGEIRGQYMGRPKRPWLWFSPENAECCPTCGQPMPVLPENV